MKYIYKVGNLVIETEDREELDKFLEELVNDRSSSIWEQIRNTFAQLGQWKYDAPQNNEIEEK